MGGFGALLIAVGIIVLGVGAYQKYQAKRMASAPFVPTGEIVSKGEAVAGDKGAISTEGDVEYTDLVTSPVTGTECLYYELKVEGTWKEGDSSRSKTYVEDKVAAAFSINDGTGAVLIDAKEGGNFDGMEKTFDETKKEGFFADLKAVAGKGEPMMFGAYAFENPPMSKADKFQCTEKVFKPAPKLYAMGKLSEGVITSPSWTALTLSPKSREELMGSTEALAKKLFMGGGIAVGVGVLFGIIGAVMG